MFIPQKYVLKDGDTPVGSGSLGIQCKHCKRMFAIPPTDITAELASATVCEDPACVEAEAKSAASDAATELKSNVDLDHTSTLK